MTEPTDTPDLTQGVSVRDLEDGGMLRGHVGEDEVLLVRAGGDLFAVGAHCTHYHGPLADGLVVGQTIRCPWHHACFSLKTGDALRAPALDPITCWRVERLGDVVVVRDTLPHPAPATLSARDNPNLPESVVIVGGGPAGLAAAQMLRREGYDGPVTIVSADHTEPCDRPNLSKDYLAGHAKDEWIPLRGAEFYDEARIELLLGSRVTAIDTARRQIVLENGTSRAYGALLLATGADPVHLPIPGLDGARAHYLRSFADSRAIVAAAEHARRAVVVGASFIGLEVAASLRSRGLEVDIVAPEPRPLERILGPEVGRAIQQIHESHGVRFHLGCTVARVDGDTVTLSDGVALAADVIVLGVGVRPATALAEQAGLALDKGIAVNEYLETSAPCVFAAGDVARWPDRRTGDRLRVEHFVVAERQGQVAARNILGRRERFDAVPFFWSQHFDVTINYVGHAEAWDAVTIDGSLEALDCAVTYTRGARRLAVATISRDRTSLEAERDLEG